ncbi:hypothetical protein F4802DRAFT_619517 [Xylaria palmicola]|nr:hypothetical protein F4802DRAFT_619517 [Xylaria palmicola]
MALQVPRVGHYRYYRMHLSDVTSFQPRCISYSRDPVPSVILASPNRFFKRSYPRHRLSLVRHLFPRSVRNLYRENLIGFHLDTLPYYKHRFQSHIYRYILEQQRRRQEQSRLVDYARRLFLGQPAARNIKHGTKTRAWNMTSVPGLGLGSGNYGADGGRERGARRRRLAAMAGSVYRAGAVAVNEIKESYNQTRSSEIDLPEISNMTIPGSFPDVTITTKGNEQMVLFPSYGKRRVEQPRQYTHATPSPPPSSADMNDQEYWRREWARDEDRKAVVDVDVRGWLYLPHKGPMTRRNRILIGLARQLSGIPAPRLQQADSTTNTDSSISSIHQRNEEQRDRERISREAQEIERKGRAEEEAAQKGDYSERPKDESSEDEGDVRRHQPSRSTTPKVRSASPTPPARTNTAGTSALSDAELAVANANLMARIGPFMTTPMVEVPITLFFYNDRDAQSRTVMTDDSGHFVSRAALPFVPTHVRVLATEDIACTEPIHVIEPRGISLISDIDDTIKRSNIALGAKEIFRNTFVRELKDLTIDGVKDWYNCLHDMGVSIHYCSNSPWQLYPVLATYFKLANLPPGSLHLKRYNGMLQGIFEPVAERKKGTLEKIMNDFPERKFLLVGDSGEADLEVYTELAIAYPGRIKGIFIRDVTTPEQPGYFDAAYDTGESQYASQPTIISQDQRSQSTSRYDTTSRPVLPPRSTAPSKSEDPEMGDLIDFSDDPVATYGAEIRGKPVTRVDSGLGQTGQTASLQGRKPPPRPAKPSALQGAVTVRAIPTQDSNGRKRPPAPPLPRRPSPGSESSTRSASLHPLSQIHNSSEQILEPPPGRTSRPTRSSESTKINIAPPPPPPPPRRRGTPSGITEPSRRRTGDSDMDANPLPGSVVRTSTNSTGGTTTPPSAGGSPNQAPLNKKLELWRRRLERAQDSLGQVGVPLYTWRRGEDVVAEAVGIVRATMKELQLQARERGS